MNRRLSLTLALFPTLPAMVAAEKVRIDVSRDTWVSAVGSERTGNNGASPRLKLKGIQEFSLVDADFSKIRGKKIVRAALHLCAASPERLGRVTVGTVAAPFDEGTGTNYAKVAGAACFELPGTSPDITAVILGQGGSLWRFADATPADAEGWQTVPVDPETIRARLDGRSHGFCVIDDVGNEWSRDGDKFTWRLFPNRYFYSRDQNARVAPWFEVETAEGPDSAASSTVAPSSPKNAAAPVTLPKSPEPKSTPIPHVTDLFRQPLHGLASARNETIWCVIAPDAPAVPDAKVPAGCSAALYEIGAHEDALVPVKSGASTPLPRWVLEINVGKAAAAGKAEVTSAGITVPLEIWDFTLPDRLSFVPQMNAYGLPDDQEQAYYRLAHRHRTCLNALRYSWQGKVNGGCAPKVDSDGTFDWAAWDKRFGPLLDGTLFKDLPRSGEPVDAFYLPLNENWPMDHEKHYRGGYWIENAYDDGYWKEFRDASTAFSRHIAEKRWSGPLFEFYLNNKVYFKAEKGSWARCSAPWIFDEPVNAQDFWALRRFGREFLTATKGSTNLAFRCDISRPEWQRDLLDGVCGEEIVSGALRPYRERIMARQVAWNQNVLLYGSPNKIGTPDTMAIAWSIDAWCLGADGIVPWNTIGSEKSWTSPDQTCLFYPHKDGPVPSRRLFAFSQGQQLIEYLSIYQNLSRSTRDGVAAALKSALALDGALSKTSEDDAGTMNYSKITPASLSALRDGLGRWLSDKKPAYRAEWVERRRLKRIDDRPDAAFFAQPR